MRGEGVTTGRDAGRGGAEGAGGKPPVSMYQNSVCLSVWLNGRPAKM